MLCQYIAEQGDTTLAEGHILEMQVGSPGPEGLDLGVRRLRGCEEFKINTIRWVSSNVETSACVVDHKDSGEGISDGVLLATDMADVGGEL